MIDKPLPFDQRTAREIVRTYPTPFYIYDEAAIRASARRLNQAFAWGDFKEYFAVKATPNPHVLKILRQEGLGGDCSSLAELVLCERVEITGENVMFTSNETPAEEYRRAKALGAIINLDDITHIPYLERHVGLPELICLRYNPGPLREGNAIIGKPEEAKYGFTRDQLVDGYRQLKARGVRRFGLHTMVASNELNPEFFVETAQMLFQLAAELARNPGVRIEFVNLGGGIGIPYRPGEKALDIDLVGRRIQQAYQEIVVPADLHPLRICMENGRYITGPYGYLVTEAIHRKSTYKEYIGVDACMSNLMRPGMYGAYHHITVLGKETAPENHMYDVVGSLCENNDKFAIDRKLPEIGPGDLLVIHDAGAHGFAMGFQYNGKLRSAELLLREDGSVMQIRRAETLDDYFATLDFSNV
jgi:diaminopimelate decarboxylase